MIYPNLMSPPILYECIGDVPTVVIPCKALIDGQTGRMEIYHGAADPVTTLAFAYVNEMLDWEKPMPFGIKRRMRHVQD